MARNTFTSVSDARDYIDNALYGNSGFDLDSIAHALYDWCVENNASADDMPSDEFWNLVAMYDEEA